MRGPALGVLLVLPLAGCGWLGNTFSFGDGAVVATPYRATVRAGEDRRDLTVTVAGAANVPLEDMRESARYAVTRYCIENFGKSEAAWATDPATQDWAVARTENGAVLEARCTGR
jgi:hypothetical protein